MLLRVGNGLLPPASSAKLDILLKPQIKLEVVLEIEGGVFSMYDTGSGGNTYLNLSKRSLVLVTPGQSLGAIMLCEGDFNSSDIAEKIKIN